MPVADRLLARLRLSGVAVPPDARVKLLRPPRDQEGHWRWRLEVPRPTGGWVDTEPAIGSMWVPSACVDAPRLRTVGDGMTISVYPEPELEPIPVKSRYKLSGTEPSFVKWKNEWCLLGPDWTLPPDWVITVRRFSDGVDVAVVVGEYLAERVVSRRLTGELNRTAGPARVRYVIARVNREPK